MAGTSSRTLSRWITVVDSLHGGKAATACDVAYSGRPVASRASSFEEAEYCFCIALAQRLTFLTQRSAFASLFRDILMDIGYSC